MAGAPNASPSQVELTAISQAEPTADVSDTEGEQDEQPAVGIPIAEACPGSASEVRVTAAVRVALPPSASHWHNLKVLVLFLLFCSLPIGGLCGYIIVRDRNVEAAAAALVRTGLDVRCTSSASCGHRSCTAALRPQSTPLASTSQSRRCAERATRGRSARVLAYRARGARLCTPAAKLLVPSLC